MEEKVQEDWLDARLRDEAAYIDDAGFTSRVAQKLPARRVRRSYRAAILLGITLVACVAAYLLAGGSWFIAKETTSMAMMPITLIWICAGAATVLVMAGGVFAALSKTRGRLR
jgi:predicted tellurium resistance membrane protein TerC